MSIVPADLFLSATLTVDEACRYLARLGFADPGTADARLQALAEDVPIREALGRVYFRTGRYRRAASEFSAIVERNPANDYAHFCLGRSFEKLGDKPAASRS